MQSSSALISSTLTMKARYADYPRARHPDPLTFDVGHLMLAPPAVETAPDELRILIVNEDVSSANTLKHDTQRTRILHDTNGLLGVAGARGSR